MLSRSELVDLYRELRDERVLSIYLDGGATDPAVRGAWRTRLEHRVAEIRKTLEARSGDELEDFRTAAELLRGELVNFDAFLPERGWVGFATSDRLWYASSVAVPMPDLVRWERGIRVAPYVRALKQQRPVVVLLVDSRTAVLYTYRDGALGEPQTLEADTFLGDLSEVGVTKRATTNTGQRGGTASDAAQRYLEVGTERLLKQAASAAVDSAGDGGYVVVGGTPEAANAAAQMLPRSVGSRGLLRPSLRVDMSRAEVREAAEEAASSLTRLNQDRLLDEVLDLARGRGKGSLGREATEKALREQRVDTLLLSRTFILENSDYADHCVGVAFDQHAEVEELSDGGATRLDEEGGGVAARLRYTVHSE